MTYWNLILLLGLPERASVICLEIHRHTWHESEPLMLVVLVLISAKIMVLYEIEHEFPIVGSTSALIIVRQRVYVVSHIETGFLLILVIS